MDTSETQSIAKPKFWPSLNSFTVPTKPVQTTVTSNRWKAKDMNVFFTCVVSQGLIFTAIVHSFHSYPSINSDIFYLSLCLYACLKLQMGYSGTTFTNSSPINVCVLKISEMFFFFHLQK